MPLQIETDVSGIGQLIRTRRLRVPMHQRSFAWDSEEVSQLWEDVTRAEIGDPDGYFVGPIVLAEPSDERSDRYLVIDGQQRLATVSLLFAALAATFRAQGDTERVELLREYLGKQDFDTLESEPRLILGDQDDGFFRDLVKSAVSGSEPPPVDERKRSHVLLKSGYELLLDRIKVRVEAAGKSWREDLGRLRTFVDGSVEVIVVKVENDQNAYLIFETLNDRGLRLTTSDLLKNHLFGRAGDRLDEVRRAWLEMTSSLAALEPEDPAPQFLRHYWISTREMVRERALYKTISEDIRTSGAAAKFSNDLAHSAERYASLANPSHPSWQLTSVRTALDVLRLFRVTTPRPLLLAALETLDEAVFRRVVESIARWSVRLAISGGLGSGATEDAYGQAARRVRDGDVTSVGALRSELMSVLPSDEAFEGALATRSLRNQRQARFLLAALEREARREVGRTDELTATLDESMVNLEHIMPRNPEEDAWEHVREDDQALYIDRIGNFALMLVKENAAAGAESFATKKSYYKKSELVLTSELDGYDEWSTDVIAERQRRLAALAVRCWPL